MKHVNISTLRANLSRLLDAVRRGQTVEILDRDQPVARLVPVDRLPKLGDRDAAFVEQLRRRGVAKIGTLRGVPELATTKPPGPAHTGAVEALIEERRKGR